MTKTRCSIWKTCTINKGLCGPGLTQNRKSPMPQPSVTSSPPLRPVKGSPSCDPASWVRHWEPLFQSSLAGLSFHFALTPGNSPAWLLPVSVPLRLPFHANFATLFPPSPLLYHLILYSHDLLLADVLDTQTHTHTFLHTHVNTHYYTSRLCTRKTLW